MQIIIVLQHFEVYDVIALKCALICLICSDNLHHFSLSVDYTKPKCSVRKWSYGALSIYTFSDISIFHLLACLKPS